MLWSDFKTGVRDVLGDGARTDDSYCYAISLWVLSELARQVARYEPKRLLLVERAEPFLFQIEQEMKVQRLTKTALAQKMHTSRAALNRLLDETDTSLTLTTLTGAAKALGKNLRIELA